MKFVPLCSDVDLAVWGVEEKLFCRAIAQLLDIDPVETSYCPCREFA
jgi:hypothetical protein